MKIDLRAAHFPNIYRNYSPQALNGAKNTCIFYQDKDAEKIKISSVKYFRFSVDGL